MDAQSEVIGVVGRVLDLGGRSVAWSSETRLLGSIPELDSMAVATLITSLEEHFAIAIEDDEIDGSVFETVGTLVAFVKSKLAA